MTPDATSLAAALRGVLGAGEVTGVERLSGGASRQTWALTGDGRPLILQRGHTSDSPTALPMTTEAALLRAAAAAGAPVPAVVAAGDGVGDGMETPWLVTERVAGETIPRKVLRNDEYAGALRSLATQCGTALARIHAISAADVPSLPDIDQLEFWTRVHDSTHDAHAVFGLALRWLESNRPDAGPATVLHGDFRLGNLLVTGDGLNGVLDWELAHLGDHHEDLAWLCVRAWRFGGNEPVGGFGSRDDLIEAYEAAGGRPVDREVLRWWEVFGTLRWGVICQIQVMSHLHGTKSLEQAAIGRRVAETEYDLLLALPGGDDLAGTITPMPEPPERVDRGLHDRPTATELIDALRHWIATDVADTTTGRTRHLTRVAANVLSMLERQLVLGPEVEQRYDDLIDTFPDDEQDLAAALWSGILDDEWDEVRAQLFPMVLDKLSVANPTYVEDRHLGPSTPDQ